MSKTAVLLIGLINACLAVSSIACISDFDCSFGKACVKAYNTVGVEGACVTPSDRNEMPDNTFIQSSSEPRQINNCQFNTDCDIGFSCMIKFGDIYGICIK